MDIQYLDVLLKILLLSINPIVIETLRKQAWTKGLKKAGLEYKPVIQTRHLRNYDDFVKRKFGVGAEDDN